MQEDEQKKLDRKQQKQQQRIIIGIMKMKEDSWNKLKWMKYRIYFVILFFFFSFSEE